MSNEKEKPKGTLLFGMVPAVPALIGLIWLVVLILKLTIGLSRTIMTPVLLATVLWFVIWLWRASRRD